MKTILASLITVLLAARGAPTLRAQVPGEPLEIDRGTPQLLIDDWLVDSRDGLQWKRSPHRTPLIPLGDPGNWDDGMTFGGPHWVEVNDEWWFYYAGHNGPHDSKERKAAIGLATCKKERLIGLRGRTGGGVVVTRLIKWPGGDLYLNAAPYQSGDSEVTVRVSDEIRDSLPGFDHADCGRFPGDAVRHQVTWREERSMNQLTGQTERINSSLARSSSVSGHTALPKMGSSTTSPIPGP